MKQPLLNEPERYLVKNWLNARKLELSMETVRKKYSETFDRVTEGVRRVRPELDASKAFVTQFWGSGSIGFGRSSWPDADSAWPPGFWVDSIRIENLADESERPPLASVWVAAKTRKRLHLDVGRSRAILADAARGLFEKSEIIDTVPSSEEVLFQFRAPSKAELLSAFLEADGQPFVDLFVAQVDLMAKLTPAMDEVFRKAATLPTP